MASDSNDTHSKDNDDIKQHLLKIEERLDRLSISPQLNFSSLSARRNNEIDLREIWSILWNGKWWIVGITFLFAALAVIYALSLSNQYKAEIVLAPAQKEAGRLGGLAAQYGGLAAMAGINIAGAQNAEIDQAIVLLKSWSFLEAFIQKYDLKPMISAVEGWDESSGKVIYRRDIFDPENRKWKINVEDGKSLEPSSYDAYRLLDEMIGISRDSKAGLVRVSVEHSIPNVSYLWSRWLIEEINNHFQMRDVNDAKKNIEYLNAKIGETSVSEMQLVFYRMVESQMKTLMLAEVSDEYLLRTVVDAKIPERKSGPNRFLIAVFGFLLGAVLSMLVVFGKSILLALKK